MTATSVTNPLPSADPAGLGFIPQRLAALGPAMQRYVDQGKVPNLVTLVARHGKIAHFEARGVMDFETRRPVAHDTIFRLYSNSKPIAGVAAMILFEEGKLTPDDPVSRFIPAFKNCVVRTNMMGVTEPAAREITIRDCFRNTSGVATPARLPLSARAQYRQELETLGWLSSADGSTGARTARERVEALARLPLNFHPGTAYEYHAGYIIIGAVMEEILQRPLDEFYRQRIFAPLGMHDTDWYLPDAKLDRFPDCYRPAQVDGGWTLQTQERATASPKVTSGPRTFFGAGGDEGGVLSTAGDYARFGQMLLNGGELDGVRILGRKTVEYMTSDHSEGMIIPMRGPGFGWGIGVVVRHSATGLPVMRSIGAYGWSGAAGTQYFGDPSEGLLLVCFTQVMGRQMMPDNTYWEEMERIVYQSLA